MTGRSHRLRLKKWGAGLLLLVVAVVGALAAGVASAEQASEPTSPDAGQLTTGRYHNCALQSAALRCWGYGGDGQHGYGGKLTIGDDETPAAAGPVDFGAGRTAIAISAGNVHTCALLDDGTVRCWGFGANGRLGYGNTNSIGDDPGETPATAGSVFLGTGRTARAITAGDGHSCAILDNDSVRCWGYGFDGRLGLNNTENIGDNETPGSVPPINFGPGRTAKAISAGSAHTCAILDDNTVRCWGFAGAGRLGYAGAGCFAPGTVPSPPCPLDVGRGCFLLNNQCNPDPNAPTVANMGPVDVGAGRTARSISAGQFHTCAVLDNNSVRCWGTGGSGRLGYGNGNTIGDDETPGTVGPVDLGQGGGARAITAGGEHTCAVLNDGNVRCWGQGVFGQLGYPNVASVGQTEDPGDVGPVDLGPGRTAKAISAGDIHTCARLDDDSVRCWGYGANGRLGYCNDRAIGDDETPGTAGPVDLGSGGARCPTTGGSRTPPPKPGVTYGIDPRVAEQARLGSLRDCLSRVRSHARREVRRARRLRGARRRRALRHARRHRRQLRRRCLRLHGRTPGQVTGLTAQAAGGRRVVLSFKAPGSDGSKPPAARTYLVKQSRRPIRSSRAFNRAPSLCKGRCSFDIRSVGATLKLTVTRLRRGRVYYFSVKARDNVSKRPGPRSKTVRVRVR